MLRVLLGADGAGFILSVLLVGAGFMLRLLPVVDDCGLYIIIGCCGAGCGTGDGCCGDTTAEAGCGTDYTAAELGEVGLDRSISLGCGNPL